MGIRQITENFKRSLKGITRSPAYTKTRIMQSVVVGLLMGLAYLNTRNDQRAAQNKAGVIFNLIMFFTFASAACQTTSIPRELKVVRREYRNGMYTTLPYFLSKVLSEIPYLIGSPLLTMLVCYFMIGLKQSFMGFVTAVAGVAGVAWAGTGLGWFLSTSTGDAAIANAIMGPIVMPFLLFGGLYQNEESTPSFFEPVKYASWYRYAFNMMMANEFQDTEILCETPQCAFHNGTDVLAHFSINPDNVWYPNMLVLLGIGGVLCLFSWSCLVCKIRR